MMTLMPVAAFAAPGDATVIDGKNISTKVAGTDLEVTLTYEKAATTSTAYIYAHQSPARQVATVNVPKDSTSATATVAMADLNVGDMIGAIIASSTPAADSIAAVEKQTNGPKVTILHLM